jgi:hypothetical protein
VTDGRSAMAEHLALLNGRIGRPLLPIVPVDFANAIKGKRTLDSMRDAVATELARAKIAASEIADRITINLRTIDAHDEHAFLFADVATLALKDPEFVTMAVKNRIADHQAAQLARMEAERARIADEERIKAQAAAQADAQAKQVSDDAITKARAESLVPEAIEASSAQHDAASPLSQPTLRLGQISERLGFTLTADFMRHLGFEPAATDKAAKLYHENDFPRICAVLVRHINRVCELQTA